MASTWVGLTASYAVPVVPPSFAILAVATGTYAVAIAAGRIRPARRAPAGAVAA